MMKILPKMIAAWLTGLFATGLCLTTAWGAEKFPDRPITVIVPYGLGSDMDVMTRALSKAAERELKVPVIIKNASGAAATLGVTELTHAAPDGYTLAAATLSSLAMSPHTMKLQYTPDDFSYLLTFARYDYAIAVQATSHVKTMADFIKWAKKKSTPATFSGIGLPPEIVADELGAANSLKFAHVPYRSGPQALLAMLTGNVDFAVATPYAAMPQLNNGDVRLLATASQRWSTAMEVPTLKELGYNIDVYSCMLLIDSKDVSSAKQDILFRAFRKAYDDANFQNMTKRLLTSTPPVERDNLKNLILEKYEQYGKVLQAIGLSKD